MHVCFVLRTIKEIQNSSFHFILQLIFGKKEFYLLNNKLKAFFAKLCSHVVIDKLCLQTFNVYRKENVNVVGGLYLFLKNPMRIPNVPSNSPCPLCGKVNGLNSLQPP